MAKKPDGLTLIPWKAGKPLTWDAPFAASYLKVFPVSQSQAAEVAADRKKVKYSTVSTDHWLIPIAVKAICSISQEGSAFLDEVGNRIAEISEDPESAHFLTKDLVL